MFVTESIGSKILFDAVRVIWDQQATSPASQQALARQLATVRIIYMVANQVPILDQANPVAPKAQPSTVAPSVAPTPVTP